MLFEQISSNTEKKKVDRFLIETLFSSEITISWIHLHIFLSQKEARGLIINEFPIILFFTLNIFLKLVCFSGPLDNCSTWICISLHLQIS